MHLSRNQLICSGFPEVSFGQDERFDPNTGEELPTACEVLRLRCYKHYQTLIKLCWLKARAMDPKGDPAESGRCPVIPPDYRATETQHECLICLRYSSGGELGSKVADLIAYGFIPLSEWENAHRGEPTWLWPICQNYNMDKMIGQLATDFTDADTPCDAPMNWGGHPDAPP